MVDSKLILTADSSNSDATCVFNIHNKPEDSSLTSSPVLSLQIFKKTLKCGS